MAWKPVPAFAIGRGCEQDLGHIAKTLANDGEALVVEVSDLRGFLRRSTRLPVSFHRVKLISETHFFCSFSVGN